MLWAVPAKSPVAPRALAVLAFFLLLTLYLTWPLPLRMGSGLSTNPDWRCCTARSKSLTSLCRLQSHPAQYVSGIPSAAILLSISHPIRCSTRCLANVRARISGPMIAL